MTININDASSWGNLPAALQSLLRDVQRGAFHYPDREGAWQQAQDYLQNGDFSTATFKLEQIQSRQNNLRQGLTQEIQVLMQSVQMNAASYPEQEDAWQQAQDYLQNGDFSTATFKLEQIQSRQNNLRQGPTQEIQVLMQSVQMNTVSYPEREDAWQQAQDYLQNGDFSTATFKLEQIQSRQNNLRQGPTQEIQVLMQSVQMNAVSYPEREDAWQQAQDYLQNGDFSTATFKLEQIQSRQNNLRRGLTPELLALMQSVQMNAVSYLEREDAWQQAQDYLQNGDFSTATFKLEQIQTRQNNLRQ
ncbi:hypothetical protein [Citrobacter koseri]|uniref:hypothetical protein n=1 Tax=Citrobacter koseri TaxID=545 RepID=UPI003D023F4F